MDFAYALEQLKLGVAVRRYAWGTENWLRYSSHFGNAGVIFHYQNTPYGQIGHVWHPNQSDLLATDWQMV